MEKAAKKRVKKRFVMGEGYPWYFTADKSGRGLYDALTLYTEPLHGYILLRRHEKKNRVPLFHSDTGNWNKVRIICEVLE